MDYNKIFKQAHAFFLKRIKDENEAEDFAQNILMETFQRGYTPDFQHRLSDYFTAQRSNKRILSHTNGQINLSRTISTTSNKEGEGGNFTFAVDSARDQRDDLGDREELEELNYLVTKILSHVQDEKARHWAFENYKIFLNDSY